MPIVLSHVNYVYSPGTPFESKALDDICMTVEDGSLVDVTRGYYYSFRERLGI